MLLSSVLMDSRSHHHNTLTSRVPSVWQSREYYTYSVACTSHVLSYPLYQGERACVTHTKKVCSCCMLVVCNHLSPMISLFMAIAAGITTHEVLLVHYMHAPYYLYTGMYGIPWYACNALVERYAQMLCAQDEVLLLRSDVLKNTSHLSTRDQRHHVPSNTTYSYGRRHTEDPIPRALTIPPKGVGGVLRV